MLPPPVSLSCLHLSSDTASSLLESPRECWGYRFLFLAASEPFPDIVAALKPFVPIRLSFVSYSLTQYRVLVSEWRSFLQIWSDHVTEPPHVYDETQLVSPGIVSAGFPRMKYDRRDLPIARKEMVKNG